MVAPNPNNSPHSLQLPTTTPARFDIVGGFAVLHLGGGAPAVAVDATRVVAIAAADIGVRALILDCGGAVLVKTSEEIPKLAQLIDEAARALEGD